MPGCGSAWKNPVDENHAEYRFRTARREDALVESGCFDRRQIDPRNAIDVFLDQQRLARPLPEDLGNDDERIVGEIRGEPLDVVGLDGEIELAFHGAGELGGNFDRLVPTGVRHFRLDQLSEMSKEPQIGLDLRANSRSTNFQHDRRVVLQTGAMHLCDRR